MRVDLEVTLVAGGEVNFLAGARWFALGAHDDVRLAGSGDTPWEALASLLDVWVRRFEWNETVTSARPPLGVRDTTAPFPPIEVTPRVKTRRKDARAARAEESASDPLKQKLPERRPRRRWY